jgi:hydroxyacylglutathione hydrolase
MIQTFTFNPLGENTLVIWCDQTLKAAIIDAGMYDRNECEVIKNFLNENKLELTLLLGTHAHIDHIFGNWWIRQEYPDVPYYLHRDDIPMIERSETMAAIWNLNYTPSMSPDNFLNHGDQISLGKMQLDVRFVPGHAPGHVIFINTSENWAIVGDTVFQGSIGRTDLPGGNHELLLNKIQSEIFTLPENMVLLPGHGPKTTVTHEKSHNPFFNS